VSAQDFSQAKKTEIECQSLHGLSLEGKKVFLTVARLEDYKGIDRAIAAISRVVRIHPEACLVICGDGPDRARLEKLVKHYRVEEFVHFTGVLTNEALKQYFRRADVFLLLSRDDYETPNVEGFGLVILEAAACGVASIGGRAGGIIDAIVEGETGWLVDPTHDEAIVAAMFEALQNPDELKRRGENARDRVLREFQWKHAATNLLKYLRKEEGTHVRN